MLVVCSFLSCLLAVVLIGHVCAVILFHRGRSKEIHCTRPHNWTTRCALVGDWPATAVHRDSQLWRRVDLENWWLSPAQVAGSRRPHFVFVLAAVLHVTLWIQDVCTHLSQRRRRWTWNTFITVLCHHAGTSCVILVLLHAQRQYSIASVKQVRLWSSCG